MKSISKALIGTVAAGAMAMGAASPAQAQWRDRDRGDGIDAGDIIAGALIIGGIAAIASAAGNDGYDRYDRYDRYNQRIVFECDARANGRITDFDVDRRRY